MTFQIDEDVYRLFDEDSRLTVGLGERYRVALFGSQDVNAILCKVWSQGRFIPRLEAIVMHGSPSITLVLDSSHTLAIDVGDFEKLVPFMTQALL
jgi:hypothetical protein